jgi:dGTPase
VLYSSALLRLGHVTQVASPEAGHIFHSRLTHTLKVAQVARRLAEGLKQDRDAGALDGLSSAVVDALDVDSVEAAALAHDLGHPPFGHLAEAELQRRAKECGSFEGNAQSFRIVTRLAIQNIDTAGLNLTRRTLNGLLKYPWLRHQDSERHSIKWGAYDEDRRYFDWARTGLVEEERTLEAHIMDWADDATYAVHDMDDFYRAGLVPLDRLVRKGEEFAAFLRYVCDKSPDRSQNLSAAAGRLFDVLLAGVRSPFRGYADERANLRRTGSRLVTRYLQAVTLESQADGAVDFIIDDSREDEVAVLKQLTWFYVIERPALGTVQLGQRTVISKLFDMYRAAAVAPDEQRLFPAAFAEQLEYAETDAARERIVVDLIAGMTENSALAVYRRSLGIGLPSVLD